MKRSNTGVLLFLSAVCAAVTILSLCIGEVCLSPKLLVSVLFHRQSLYSSIFWYARVPRTAAALLTGAALSAAGCVLQSVLANRLASPGVIGVNAGAGAGVTICCAVGCLSGWAISVSAFLGSLAAIVLICLLSYSTGASKTTVILCGVALNSVFSALTEAITVLIPDAAVLNLDFRVGGFSAVSYISLIPAAVLIVLALVVLTGLHNELDVLSLGDETAHGLGLHVRYLRLVFLILSALLAGAAVSISGLLGFVGLIVPHFVRKLVGNESKRLLPAVVLTGASFVALSDLVARTVFLPYELPVGIMMSVIGGPAFLLLLIQYKGGRRHG